MWRPSGRSALELARASASGPRCDPAARADLGEARDRASAAASASTAAEALAEQRGHVAAGARASGRPRSSRPPRSTPRAGTSGRGPSAAGRVASVKRCRSSRHGCRPAGREVGRPSSSSMTFTVGPSWASRPARSARRGAPCAAGRRSDEHGRAATSSPPASTTPSPATARPRRRCDSAARARAAPASAWSPRHPPRANPHAPAGSVALAEVVEKPTNAVRGPRPASVPIRPWMANGTRTRSDGMAARSSRS